MSEFMEQLKVQDGELFFTLMIREGLSLSDDNLTDEEEEFLNGVIPDIFEDSRFTPEISKKLTAKCVAALTAAYARDTAGKNHSAALNWRTAFENMYGKSTRFVTHPVQEWYLSVGRAQEKHATGCFTILLGISGVSFLIGALAA